MLMLLLFVAAADVAVEGVVVGVNCCSMLPLLFAVVVGVAVSVVCCLLLLLLMLLPLLVLMVLFMLLLSVLQTLLMFDIADARRCYDVMLCAVVVYV